MAKGEAKKNNAFVDQERTRATGEHATTMGYMNPERMKEKEYSDKTRDDIYGRFGRFASGDFGPGGAGGSGGSSSSGGGGYNPAQIGLVGTLADARGRYKDFADTGGYTEGDKTNIRAQGNAPIAGMFGGLQRTMDQKRAAGQSSNIGFGDSLQRMAREQSRAGATAARETELGIMDRVNQGKQWGLTGYTGVGNTEQGIEEFNANARNAAASQGASESGANERFNRGLQLDAANSMKSLWGTQAGELSRYDDTLMKERGMASDQYQSSNQQRMNYNPNKSWMDNLQQGMDIAGGAVGAFTGLGNVKNMFKGKNMGATSSTAGSGIPTWGQNIDFSGAGQYGGMRSPRKPSFSFGGGQP